MANRPTAAQPLSTEDKQLLRSWLVEFNQSWTPDRLTVRAQSLPPVGDRLRLPALVELVKIDLRRRWELNDPVELENYLGVYPEIGSRESVPASLIKVEYEARVKAGTPSPLEEMKLRFPRQAAVLEQAVKPVPVKKTTEETVEAPPRSETPSTPAAPAPEKFPERIANYKVLRILGQGGMGTVYLARDEKLDRDVALKVPKFDPKASRLVIDRFYREAKAAAALHHPNVCAIHEIGEADGVPFLTMGYIEGRPLNNFIDRNGVNPLQAALLVRKLALALKEAHQLGIVHRDLKPSNIMIDQRKEPVVMDFGLARLERQEIDSIRQNGDAKQSADDSARLTRLGAVIGTPHYMSPEQVAGDIDAMGPRCDIYSLGVILYELLTGRTPFAGPPSLVLGLVMAQTAPPPSDYRPDLDKELVAICMKAIAREPSARYASMDAMAAALSAWLKNATRGQSTSPVAQLVPVATAAPVALSAPVARVAEADTQVTIPEKKSVRRPINWRIVGPAIGGGVLLLVLVLVVVLNAFKDKPPVGPPVAKPAKLRMIPFSALTVEPGEKELLQIAVVRENCTGPIRIDIEGLPDEVLLSRRHFLPPEEDSLTLEMTALPKAQPIQTQVTVIATLDKQRVEGRFAFTIKTATAPPPSTVGLVVAKQFSMLSSQSSTLEVSLRRQNYFGPVTLSVEDLPAKVACKAITIPAGEDVGRLEIVAADAKPEVYPVRVVATAERIRTEEKISLSILNRTFLELAPMGAVAIEQGKKAVIEIKLKRHNCEGAVQLSLEGLPEGIVGGRPFFIGESEESGQFTLFAETDAVPAKKAVRLIAKLDKLEAETSFEFTLAVAAPDRVGMKFPAGPLPRPLGIKRNWGPEQVTGPPDSHLKGDVPTAWTSATADDQDEWLLLEYDEPIQPVALTIYETFNPGAVSKVCVFKEDGTEVEAWFGRDPVKGGIAIIPLKLDFKIKRVLLHIESTKVLGWNSIDAVGITDINRKIHWAVAAMVSSYYMGPKVD